MKQIHHQLDGCESEHTLGDSEGQGNLACWTAELDMTEQLNNEGRRKNIFTNFSFFFQEQSHINIFVCLRLFSV